MNRAALLVQALALVLLAGSLGLPALPPPAAAPAPGADLQQAMDPAFTVADRMRASADRLAGPGPLSTALADTLGLTLPAPEPASQGLDEALSRLAQAAGLSADAPQQEGFAALPAETRQALTSLVDAVRESNRLLDQAFGALSPDERAFLRANALRLDQAGSAAQEDQELVARLEALAARVDPFALRASGLVLLQAAEGVPASLPGPAVPDPVAVAIPGVPGVPALPWPQVCGSFGSSLVDATGMVEVGFASNNGYLTERVLLLDLGGNDCYENHPAAVGPTTPFPVSLLLDLGGNDRYHSGNPHPGSAAVTWASGVGIGGAGVLVDRWGDDVHTADLTNEPLNCNVYGGGNHWQRVYAQGVGILGVGALVDASGNDAYQASNLHDTDTPSCHWNRVYTFAQGVGARIGLGLLADDTGDDHYTATAFAKGKYDNNAHTQAQAAAAARGVGLLVEKEGQDVYNATAQAYTGTLAFTDKGNFAYTFAQASLYGANEPRLEAVPLLQGITAAQAKVGCLAVAGGPQGGTSLGMPCDLQAVALLADVLGQDRYEAWSHAWDNNLGCTWAAWSVASAQGSAPAKGAAVLVDLSIDETNQFVLQSDADAKDCATLGVRSAAYGQGFGGAILWDHWDAPPFDPLLITDLSVGALLRGGLCDGPNVAVSIRPPTVNPTIPPTVTPGTIAFATDLTDLCKSSWSSDTYAADAHAINDGSGIAWSRTDAQGSGNGVEQDPVTVPGKYDSLGLGLNADVFGNDDFRATARSDSVGFAFLDPMVVAQGAGYGAGGILVNVGDDDGYFADALGNGAPWSGPIVAQADAVSQLVTICLPTGTCITQQVGLGVLVDALGADLYSQPCAFNGLPLVPPAIWGNVPTLSCVHNNGIASSGLILGVDATV